MVPGRMDRCAIIVAIAIVAIVAINYHSAIIRVLYGVMVVDATEK